MTTQTIRKERGFLGTRLLAGNPATRGSGPVREFLREAGETLRGAFEAPLRQALSTRTQKSLDSLGNAIRRDIGL
ncbi:MAG: hypothetical protein OER43_04035 [Gammaproteobacteria bacterium]|nr:hypothetical protein [Gammaproteobacteria bacterium]MDH3413439.1 hypothetical protein [Gammaproteobacteria bacterium]